MTADEISELKLKIRVYDSRITRLEKKREATAQALAEALSKFRIGSVIQKEGSHAGLWVVEDISLSTFGDIGNYVIGVRRLNKDGKPGKLTTGFHSSWDIGKCSLVERAER